MKENKELKMLLEKVSDTYDDFVYGIMLELQTKEQQDNMISCLKANPDLDTSTIINHLHEFSDEIPKPFKPIEPLKY